MPPKIGDDMAGFRVLRFLGSAGRPVLGAVAILALVVVAVALWRPWQHPHRAAESAEGSATTAPKVPGPRAGDGCDDWMKFGVDSQTGQEILCSAAPNESLLWHSTATDIASAMAGLPSVGKSGSPCSAAPYTLGRSSDGYAVWCLGAPRALLPGGNVLDTPDQQTLWVLYSP